MTVGRVSVYIDGYNLYHAIDDLKPKENHLKWVDLWALSETLVLPGEAVITVKYFSAYANWKGDSLGRHQKYVTALKEKGVEFINGRFKKKRVKCKKCDKRFYTREEKETDVNIGVHLMADGLQDRFDRALVISADTDLNGAVDLTRTETVGKQIDIFALKRKNNNSKDLCKVSMTKLRNSLLPAEIICDGKKIIRPKEYDPPQN